MILFLQRDCMFGMVKVIRLSENFPKYKTKSFLKTKPFHKKLGLKFLICHTKNFIVALFTQWSILPITVAYKHSFLGDQDVDKADIIGNKNDIDTIMSCFSVNHQLDQVCISIFDDKDGS